MIITSLSLSHSFHSSLRLRLCRNEFIFLISLRNSTELHSCLLIISLSVCLFVYFSHISWDISYHSYLLFVPRTIYSFTVFLSLRASNFTPGLASSDAIQQREWEMWVQNIFMNHYFDLHFLEPVSLCIVAWSIWEISELFTSLDKTM